MHCVLEWQAWLGEEEMLGVFGPGASEQQNSAPTFHLPVGKQISGFSLFCLLDDRFPSYCLPRKNVVLQPRTWIPGSW